MACGEKMAAADRDGGRLLVGSVQRVAGLENNTSFIRAVRSGRLHAVAKPVSRGRSTQLWEAWIWDEHEHLVAQGRVRLLCFDADRALG